MSTVEKTAVHECGHAICLLAFGYVPEFMLVSGGPDGGFVRLSNDVDEYAAAVVGAAGAEAVAQVFGPDADAEAEAEMSPSDFALMSEIFGLGKRSDIVNMVNLQTSRLVAQHTQGIVDLANYILSFPPSGLVFKVELSKADIGAFVRSTSSLRQFSHLFDGLRLDQARSMSASPTRTATPKMSTRGYLENRLLSGKGRLPANMSRAQVIENLRRHGGHS